jgi:hypothetical protein
VSNFLQHCTDASNDLYVIGVRWSAATMVRLMSGASTALRSGLSLGELLGRVRDRSSSALAWYALYSVHVPIRGVLMSVASSSVTTLVDSRLFPHLRVIVRVWVCTLFAPVLFVCGGTLERYNQRTLYERTREDVTVRVGRGEQRRRLDTAQSVLLLEHFLQFFAPHFVLFVHSHADLRPMSQSVLPFAFVD